jgi:hypothetical protein
MTLNGQRALAVYFGQQLYQPDIASLYPVRLMLRLSRLPLEGKRIACLAVCFQADFSGKL